MRACHSCSVYHYWRGNKTGNVWIPL